MADIYSTELFPFKAGDIIKIILNYSYRQLSNNNSLIFNKGISEKDRKFTRILYFQILNNKQITTEVFLNVFINNILINGFCKIQCTTIRWDKIKIESALRAEKISLTRPLKGIYGFLDDLCDVEKGFQFNLYPAKGGSTKRFSIRGIPNKLNLFDAEDSSVKDEVLQIEKLFLIEIGNENFSFQFVTTSKQYSKGIEFITSAEAVRLQTFNTRKKRILKSKITTKYK